MGKQYGGGIGRRSRGNYAGRITEVMVRGRQSPVVRGGGIEGTGRSRDRRRCVRQTERRMNRC